MIIIHIGSPRTGTTSIQQFLHHTQNDLLNLGITLVPSGWSLGGHAVLRESMIKLSGIEKSRFQQPILSKTQVHEYIQIRNELRHLLLNPPSPHLLISTESFWTMNPRRLFEVFPELRMHECRIVCCLRATEAFVKSHYAQKVKSGKTDLPFLKWLKYNLHKYQYQDTLDLWKLFFGDKNIISYAFEKARSEGIIATFLYQLAENLSISSQKISSLLDTHQGLSLVHANKTPCDAALELLMHINQMNASETIKKRLRKLVIKHRSDLILIESDDFKREIPKKWAKLILNNNNNI